MEDYVKNKWLQQQEHACHNNPDQEYLDRGFFCKKGVGKSKAYTGLYSIRLLQGVDSISDLIYVYVATMVFITLI